VGVRIGLISTPWTPVPPPLYGGTEAVVDLLARGYHEAGHDVLLFATGDSRCPVPTQWAMAESQGGRVGLTVYELYHVLEAYEAMEGVDVVHDHTSAGPVVAPLVRDVPIVATVHVPLREEPRRLYEWSAQRATVVCVSQAQRDLAPKLDVARVIHHGIRVSEFSYGTGDGGYCLYLGRMAPQKGVHRAIEAARLAGVPLVIAAKMREAWEYDYFNDQVKPKLSGDVEYVGEASFEEKVELLARASTLLFPIRWEEPFGLVMLEAMASGTPVIAFREASTPEIVEHGRTGFLCDSEAEMAAAIGRVDEIDRAACRTAVETRFSAERMVAEYLALFEEVAERA
jgi:glycosyltransferase involved in cell wall biosynthesis